MTTPNDELQRQIAAAVAEALAPATARIAELEGQLGQSEAAAAVAAATEPLTARVAELESLLAASQLEAQAAEQARVALEQQIATAAAAAAEAEAAEARREGRVASVKAAVQALATDEWVKTHEARWATMTDEAFEAELEAYKPLAARLPGASPPPPPATPSALTASAGPDPRNNGLADDGSDTSLAEYRALRSGVRT